jgi:hypothetical protein
MSNPHAHRHGSDQRNFDLTERDISFAFLLTLVEKAHRMTTTATTGSRMVADPRTAPDDSPYEGL